MLSPCLLHLAGLTLRVWKLLKEMQIIGSLGVRPWPNGCQIEGAKP
jgi:hypothetical protein